MSFGNQFRLNLRVNRVSVVGGNFTQFHACVDVSVWCRLKLKTTETAKTDPITPLCMLAIAHLLPSSTAQWTMIAPFAIPYHWTDNSYIASRYFLELVTSNVMQLFTSKMVCELAAR